ncbi:hypothetical protein NGH33_01915 [Micrococcus yunnanensis]|nr:hypothetical protein [Micrococcus yunnanensis]MCO0632731.1 hypothetical protein [Micrococcus yunnanensis]
MTRPMPYTEAPPHPGRSPKFSGDDVGHEERLAAREAWDDARWKYTESIVVGRDKRLSAAECEAEWDAAEQDASTALLYHVLGDKRLTAWQVERFDNAARTWRRFATHPHALEDSP